MPQSHTISIKAPLTYRLLVTLLTPLVFLFSLREAWKNKDWRYFQQRLGWNYPTFDVAPLWIHCASVGEVKAADPLIRALHQEHPQIPLLITSGTVTSADICEQTLAGVANHAYLPFDTPNAVKRFLNRVNPRTAIILETEIWPSLFAACAKRNCNLVIVNGRLSSKTLNTGQWIKALYKRTLNHVTKVLARSEEDGRSFNQLGVAKAKIQVLGNIKFANIQSAETTSVPTLIDRPYWLAASTHADEELQISSLQKEHADNLPLLVIAPRHPKRRADIELQLNTLGIEYSVRSKGEIVTDTTQVYLADTLGELVAFMTHARWIFMGGSLAPIGGHNLLEPAALAKPIISGPNLDNFKEEAQLLLNNKALLISTNLKELESMVLEMNNNQEHASKLGDKAKQAVSAQDDMLDRYLTALEGFIPLQ